MNAQLPVLGIGTRAPMEKQENMVFDLACRTAEKLGCPAWFSAGDVMANTDYVGEGYGLPTESGLRRSKCSRNWRAFCLILAIPPRGQRA